MAQIISLLRRRPLSVPVASDNRSLRKPLEAQCEEAGPTRPVKSPAPPLFARALREHVVRCAIAQARQQFPSDASGETGLRDGPLTLPAAQVGIERVMLGSDYCYDMGETHPVDFVDSLGLGAEQRQQVLRGTAAKLLKI